MSRPIKKIKIKKQIPFCFVLDELETLSPQTRSMFGCIAVYLEDKIVLVLRDKPEHKRDNGVWLATSPEHHAALKPDFPIMRSIELFGTPITSWQNLPADSPDFENLALKACRLIKKNDPRIGKVPTKKKSKATQKKVSKK